jgi:hypothetical protein
MRPTCLITKPPKLCPMNTIFGGRVFYHHQLRTPSNRPRHTSCGLLSISSKFNSVFAWSFTLAVDMACGFVTFELYPYTNTRA